MAASAGDLAIMYALLASDKAFLQVLEHEKVYLEALPSAAMYERSYMHRDQITQVAVAQATDFIITGSKDGHLKFWKKRAEGIEFVKHFRAHLGAVDGELVAQLQCMQIWLGPARCPACLDRHAVGMGVCCDNDHVTPHACSSCLNPSTDHNVCTMHWV